MQTDLRVLVALERQRVRLEEAERERTLLEAGLLPRSRRPSWRRLRGASSRQPTCTARPAEI